ncbi:Myb-like DNA-binding protein [Phytophthora palmivora]|uniref:Myb-like DNA-binding protein n=1 Tax=Phytophthora palmivora TaxID=4796 RepID=A0A2P4WX15_9STRA|nr:Myb-like DNA-binding protein [Phytophthora palmivora]
MTISANVRKELFEMTNSEGKLIRIKPTEAKAGTTVYSSKQSQPLKMWTQEEHEKFLEAMEKYPAGPWKVIAAFIGTKTTRQTMTHAQKYRQKISRWRRGLRHKGRKQAGDDGSQHSEADAQEYSAKENLFKAIEYVSSDEMVSQSSVSPTRSLTGVPGHEAPRSELFRLAELASIEVMKQEPLPVPTMPSSPPDVEMADMSSPVIKEEVVARASVEFSEKIRKMEWGNNQSGFIRPSPEWCMQKTEVRLSPLRTSPDGSPFPARKFGGVLSAITEMSYQNAQNRLPLPLPSTTMHGLLSPMRVSGAEERKMQQQQQNAFRLPPLNVASGQAPSVYSIPPLRSKIDPSVLSGRTYYTPTN